MQTTITASFVALAISFVVVTCDSATAWANYAAANTVGRQEGIAALEACGIPSNDLSGGGVYTGFDWSVGVNFRLIAQHCDPSTTQGLPEQPDDLNGALVGVDTATYAAIVQAFNVCEITRPAFAPITGGYALFDAVTLVIANRIIDHCAKANGETK